MRSALVVLLAVVLSSASGHAGQESSAMVVGTDKDVYAKNETMRVSVTNQSKVKAFCHAASMTPTFFIDRIEHKNDQGLWEGQDVRCRWPACDIDFDFPGPLDAGKTVSFEWTPVQHDKLSRKNVGLEAGTYRLVGSYQLRPDGSTSKEWDWREARSNEFVIEE
jgi:hypothetical protein